MTQVALFLILSLQGGGVGPGNELDRVLFPASADKGTIAGDWDGPGAKDLAAAKECLVMRDKRVKTAQIYIDRLLQAVEEARFAKTDGSKNELRAKILALGKDEVDKARAELLAALEQEKKRLELLAAASTAAAAVKAKIPKLERKAIAKLAGEIAQGKRRAIVDTRIEVYRNISRALGDYLTGDLIGSIDSMRLAERDAPEITIVHVYLGSFYYLVSQPERAMAQWKIALKLDPDNVELREAVRGTEVGLND